MIRREAVVLLLAIALVACEPPVPTPTVEVAAEPFVRRVTAEGILEAETVTTLSVAPDVRTSVRLAWIAPDGAAVDAGDVVARFDERPMEELLEDGRSSLRSTELEMEETTAGADAEQAGIRTDLALADLELALAERFQKTDDEVWSRFEIVESGIDAELAHERRAHAEAKGETQRRRTRSDLDILTIAEGQARSRIEEAETGLEGLEVRAPHDGLFLRARDWRGDLLEVGQELWRGRPVGELPDLSTMRAKVHVLEADAGGIAAGQEAEVVIEARPGEVHRAKVGRVDAIAKPREAGSPVQYFAVELAFEDPDLDVMKPGQRVRATIFLSRLDEAIVVPRPAVVLGEAGGRVWVREGTTFVPREVEVGPASRGSVVITKGLAPGDVVALEPPKETAGEGPSEGGEPAG